MTTHPTARTPPRSSDTSAEVEARLVEGWRRMSPARRGGHESERQWRDVIAMLRVQGAAVDVGSLRETAREAALEDLLERALAGGTGD
jgi:hypothetical protein